MTATNTTHTTTVTTVTTGTMTTVYQKPANDGTGSAEEPEQEDDPILLAASMKLEVNDPPNYVQDVHVREAYVETLANLTSIDASVISVDLTFSDVIVTATFKVLIAVVDGAPVMDVQATESLIAGVTPSAFMELLNAKVDEKAGAGVYTQTLLEADMALPVSMARVLRLPLAMLSW
eukprot:CAMPEP_0197699266 /NCGR_PEP_ID=MMETSP1338-20131121/120382_1 /TAXON_ID=43686 ORGANISM="Pelagodinium beii, Strain RCC1491" /NCGR_SAMPLE_ID=MMETSP1338 /ASSEMBLY_ACC=CAM_ASM_000754 /LENGTH=176 /DNA_ID=CAMNT_0043282737 /DNA_START=208 /DNA_END=735 /DNA_ORIENTATION=+